MSRKRMKCIVSGLLHSFSSRRNDVGGYWGLGVIYNDIIVKGESTIFFDLLSGASTPEVSYSHEICEPYREWVFDQLSQNGLSMENIHDVFIELKFNVLIPRKDRPFKNCRGEPYICTVTIVDDLAKEHRLTVQGWVAAYGTYSQTFS